MGPTTAEKDSELKREEKWDELTYDVRIERLKTALSSAIEQLSQQARIIAELTNKLYLHQHDENGTPYIKNQLGSNGVYGSDYGIRETAAAIGNKLRSYGLE